MLETYSLVLFVQESAWFRERVGKLSLSEDKNLLNISGKVLLLSTNSWQSEAEQWGLEQKVITEEEVEEICSLYYLYEFSNRFRIVSRENNYGSVFNLVDSGLLTYEEAFEAILR